MKKEWSSIVFDESNIEDQDDYPIEAVVRKLNEIGATNCMLVYGENITGHTEDDFYAEFLVLAPKEEK